MSRYLIVLIIILASIGLGSAAISISQSLFEQTVSPGDHVVFETNISTQSQDQFYNFTNTILGLAKSPSGAMIEVAADKDMVWYTARPFLNVSPADFPLEPNSSQKITVEGDVPSDAKPGGRYAILNIKSAPKNGPSSAGGSASIVPAIDIPIVLTVQGQLTKTGTITGIKNDAISAQKENFTVVFQNTGNINYIANATADLKDKSGQVVANTSTPYSPSSLLPDEPRYFELRFSPAEALKPGSYMVHAIVELVDGTVLASKETTFSIS